MRPCCSVPLPPIVIVHVLSCHSETPPSSPLIRQSTVTRVQGHPFLFYSPKIYNALCWWYVQHLLSSISSNIFSWSSCLQCPLFNFQGGSVSFHLETQKMVIRAQTVTGVQTPACIRPRISYNSHYSLIFLSEKPANQWMSFSSGLCEIVWFFLVCIFISISSVDSPPRSYISPRVSVFTTLLSRGEYE